MLVANNFGLKENLIDNIVSILKNYKTLDKAVIFGSRARGEYKYNSDIDIALFGNNLTKNDFFQILNRIDEIDTHFSFDILHYDTLLKPELKNNIIKDGVVIYESR